MTTTPEDPAPQLSLPRRMSAQAHANLTERLGEAYTSLPAEEKQRLRAQEKDRLLRSQGLPPMGDPWDVDIDQVMSGVDINTILAATDSRAALWPWVRELMAQAWQHGYTAGMADAAKLEEQAADAARQRGQVWNPMSQTYVTRPEQS